MLKAEGRQSLGGNFKLHNKCFRPTNLVFLVVREQGLYLGPHIVTLYGGESIREEKGKISNRLEQRGGRQGAGWRLILLGSYIMRVSGVKANEWPAFIWAKPCGSPNANLPACRVCVRAPVCGFLSLFFFFFTCNKLAESDNKVHLGAVRDFLPGLWSNQALPLPLCLRFPPSLSILSQLIRKALWKDEVGRNQNKWILLKPAMHQLLDKVINKQLRIVID